MMTIEKVDNGYIVKTSSRTLIFCTLKEVFSQMLLQFEGKDKYVSGELCGRVEIIITEDPGEVDPA